MSIYAHLVCLSTRGTAQSVDGLAGEWLKKYFDFFDAQRVILNRLSFFNDCAEVLSSICFGLCFWSLLGQDEAVRWCECRIAFAGNAFCKVIDRLLPFIGTPFIMGRLVRRQRL